MNAEQYANHWATLTGRPVSEIYIPRDLREEQPVATADKEETAS